MSKRDKSKVAFCTAFVLFFLCMILFILKSQQNPWEGKYYGEEYIYGQNGAESYECLSVSLEIEEIEEQWLIRVEVKRKLGSANGIDVVVLNIVSGETQISKQSEKGNVHFSMVTIPELEEKIFILLEKRSTDCISFKFSEQETGLEDESAVMLKRYSSN